MKVASLLLLAILFFMSFATHAEGGCPPGMIPYSGTNVSSCAPIPGYNQSSSQQQSQAPPIRWASKWGAIAADSSSGGYGVSTNMSSREDAEASAISECHARGGKNCIIETWYRNSCAATVIGNNFHSTNNATTENEAIHIGMEKCDASDANCHVYYSACSPAQRVQ